MLKRAFVAPVLAILCVAGPGTSLADETTAQKLFRYLEAEPVDCPEGLDAFGMARAAVCASVDSGFGDFKYRLRKFLKFRKREMGLIGYWQEDAPYRSRLLLAPPELLHVMFDAESHTVIALPHESCIDDTVLDDPNLHLQYDRDLTAPQRTKYTAPDYPAEARSAKLSGVVVVHAVIDGQGRLDDACVAYVNPTGFGFEPEALSTVRQWEFQPGSLDGAPVTTWVSFVVTWQGF